MFWKYGNQWKLVVTIKFNKLRKCAAYGDQHLYKMKFHCRNTILNRLLEIRENSLWNGDRNML